MTPPRNPRRARRLVRRPHPRRMVRRHPRRIRRSRGDPRRRRDRRRQPRPRRHRRRPRRGPDEPGRRFREETRASDAIAEDAQHRFRRRLVGRPDRRRGASLHDPQRPRHDPPRQPERRVLDTLVEAASPAPQRRPRLVRQDRRRPRGPGSAAFATRSAPSRRPAGQARPRAEAEGGAPTPSPAGFPYSAAIDGPSPSPELRRRSGSRTGTSSRAPTPYRRTPHSDHPAGTCGEVRRRGPGSRLPRCRGRGRRRRGPQRPGAPLRAGSCPCSDRPRLGTSSDRRAQSTARNMPRAGSDEECPEHRHLDHRREGERGGSRRPDGRRRPRSWACGPPGRRSSPQGTVASTAPTAPAATAMGTHVSRSHGGSSRPPAASR